MTITPPPELFTEWLREALQQHGSKSGAVAAMVANRAAQWGADQGLEDCVQTLKDQGWHNVADDLRAARRPKRLSRKSQGFDALDRLASYNGDTEARAILLDILEALPDD